jgi:TrmH family RNA methyltransferase
MLERIRFVLVRPIRSGNVGSVSRAMMNMGLSDLVLVNPACDRGDGQAQGFAARAKPLLDAARIVTSLSDALSDCVMTFAASAKGGFHRKRVAVEPRQAAEMAIASAARGPVAIAFGPEDRGLLQEEILDFDRVIEIPANPEYPALNLAAATTIIAYELRQAALRGTASPVISSPDPPADDGRKRVLYAKLFDALEEIGFFRQQQDPNHLRYGLRRIFGRADLTVNEVDILIGLAQQIRSVTKNRDS